MYVCEFLFISVRVFWWRCIRVVIFCLMLNYWIDFQVVCRCCFFWQSVNFLFSVCVMVLCWLMCWWQVLIVGQVLRLMLVQGVQLSMIVRQMLVMLQLFFRQLCCCRCVFSMCRWSVVFFIEQVFILVLVCGLSSGMKIVLCSLVLMKFSYWCMWVCVLVLVGSRLVLGYVLVRYCNMVVFLVSSQFLGVCRVGIWFMGLICQQLWLFSVCLVLLFICVKWVLVFILYSVVWLVSEQVMGEKNSFILVFKVFLYYIEWNLMVLMNFIYCGIKI